MSIELDIIELNNENLNNENLNTEIIAIQVKVKCDKCEKSFLDRNIDKHLKICGVERTDKVKCEKCEKCFVNTQLNKHLLSCGKEKKKYVPQLIKCEKCNKEFGKGNFNRHNQICGVAVKTIPNTDASGKIIGGRPKKEYNIDKKSYYIKKSVNNIPFEKLGRKQLEGLEGLKGKERVKFLVNDFIKRKGCYNSKISYYMRKYKEQIPTELYEEFNNMRSKTDEERITKYYKIKEYCVINIVNNKTNALIEQKEKEILKITTLTNNTKNRFKPTEIIV